ncbi:hypothetical protein HanXRQr2_Chr12g0563941 [Helianthus annuus]|uniref:Uncharacterized protein n=1 Tax=Helianthus annuus TaxID=4232 RepID=A0A9K3HK93_HELAN|nr:hypothetical protein HanXRQr2_Chr12g0563941 [Helianthus annuus]
MAHIKISSHDKLHLHSIIRKDASFCSITTQKKRSISRTDNERMYFSPARNRIQNAR